MSYTPATKEEIEQEINDLLGDIPGWILHSIIESGKGYEVTLDMAGIFSARVKVSNRNEVFCFVRTADGEVRGPSVGVRGSDFVTAVNRAQEGLLCKIGRKGLAVALIR
jgi:hypothetical protein